MATYAIGDVQGCRPELEQLLERIKFDPAADNLWFVGDLVARGGDSLGVLRLVHQLGKRARVVLGNHDLHLLAQWSVSPAKRRKDAEFSAVFGADDAQKLRQWLQTRPLVHRDKALGFSMVHAGLAPSWSLGVARRLGREVESVLQGPRANKFFRRMYGNRPAAWADNLRGWDRLRAITNFLTRVRVIDKKGNAIMSFKGSPERVRKNQFAWFDHPRRKALKMKLVCGHWSALGLHTAPPIYALDTGCVWGGQLTALMLEDERRVITVPALPHRSR